MVHTDLVQKQREHEDFKEHEKLLVSDVVGRTAVRMPPTLF